MKLDTIFYQENKILPTVESSIFRSVSTIQPTEITIIRTFLQGLFLQHLHQGVNTVLSLQLSLLVSLRDDILCHLYRGVYTVGSLQPSLPVSPQDDILHHL